MAYGDVDNQVQAYESKGLESLKQMQQSNPKLLAGIALENLQRDMQDRDRANKMSSGPAGPSVLDKKLGIASQPGLTSQEAISTAAPGLQAQGQRMKAQQLQSAMQPSAQMGAPNMAQMAGGGIVGYAQGELVGGGLPTLGAVPPSPVGDSQIKQFADQFNALKAGAAAATTPEDKAQSQQLMQELIQGMGDQHGAVMQYIDSTKGLALPTSQMAKGGPVQRFQQGLSVEGDPLTQDSVTETGERIVALAGPNGVPVTEEEYVAFMETGQLPANRNAQSEYVGDTVLEGLRKAVESTFSRPTETSLNIEEQYKANPSARIAGELNPTAGGPGANMLERGRAIDETFGNAIFGAKGLIADQRDIAANPEYDTLGKQIGAQGVATGEAVIQSLLKTLGMGVNLGIGGLESLVDVGEGGATELNVQSEELVAAAVEKAENQFTLDMTPLVSQLQELNSNADVFSTEEGKARIAALEQTIRSRTAEYNKNIESLRQTPSLAEAVRGYPQGILNAMQNYQNDPSSTMVGRFLGNQRAVYDEQKARPAEEARIASINEASDLARQNEELASMSPEERFNQLFRQPEDVAGAGQGQTSDQRQTQRLADAKTQFAIDNPEKKGIADLMQSDKAASILDVIRKLGYAGGASKGYEGQAIFQGMQAERDAETKAGRDRDMLDTELDARLSLMREERDIQARAAQGMGLAEYAATLDDNYIMSTEKYRTMKEELERAAGKGAMDTSWYGKADKEGVERAMAIYAGELKAEMIAAYKTQLEAFNPTANQSPAVAPAVSSEGWGQVEVTP
tara:strand:+ start:83 stop:2473 length:2391 start_codon:yes stop_codon:yes gene_type:complete